MLFIWKLLCTVHKKLSPSLSPWLSTLPVRDSDDCALSQLKTFEEVKWPTYCHKTGRAIPWTQVSSSKSKLLCPLHMDMPKSLTTTNAKWQGGNWSSKVFPFSKSLSSSDSKILCLKKKWLKKMVWNSFLHSLLLFQWNLTLSLWNTGKGWGWSVLWNSWRQWSRDGDFTDAFAIVPWGQEMSVNIWGINFIFWLSPQHAEVLRPGIEPMLQWWER